MREQNRRGRLSKTDVPLAETHQEDRRRHEHVLTLATETEPDPGAAVSRAGVPARAWLVWGVGLLAYVAAVFHRSSLAVTGVEAQQRFSAGASMISLFLVVQLALYAGMQVPVGVMLDRIGSRRMLVLGALTMAAGQLALALATSIPAAIGARILVGTGDAMTFISVLRVVTFWFPGRITPVMTQLSGILGTLGQILAAYPLVALLGVVGWTPTFAGAAGVGILVSILVWLAMRDAPPGTVVPTPDSLTEVRRNLLAAAKESGTRLGLYTHMVSQFSGMVFVLFWGYPFLVLGEGLAPGTAAGLLTLLVVIGMVYAPVLGHLVARWPVRRSVMVFTIVGATMTIWTVVLLWPGPAPLPLLVALIAILATNGPTSAVGFDFARTHNPAERVGSASGIVNVGGFIASLIIIPVMGIILDALTPGTSTQYSLNAFRIALLVQYPFWLIGLYGVYRHRRELRARLASQGIEITPLLTAVSNKLHR